MHCRYMSWITDESDGPIYCFLDYCFGSACFLQQSEFQMCTKPIYGSERAIYKQASTVNYLQSPDLEGLKITMLVLELYFFNQEQICPSIMRENDPLAKLKRSWKVVSGPQLRTISFQEADQFFHSPLIMWYINAVNIHENLSPLHHSGSFPTRFANY